MVVKVTIFYSYIARVIIAYAFFIFGCYVLDKQTLFEVLLPNFIKAPGSSFLFVLLVLYISVRYIYKWYKIKRKK